jgi:hypothetical protein
MAPSDGMKVVEVADMPKIFNIVLDFSMVETMEVKFTHTPSTLPVYSLTPLSPRTTTTLSL